MLAVILNQHLIKRRKQEEYKTAHSSPPDYETKNIVSSSDGVSCAEKDEIKTQGGKVTLYTERPKSKYSYTLICTDIDVDDDVQTLTLISNSHEIEADYVMYDFRSVKKQFPNVETLVITEMVIDVYVSNMMFPNLKQVVSKNKTHLSGGMLARKCNDGQAILQNVFCHSKDYVIDMAGITKIEDYAFDGCQSENIINTGDITSCSKKSFYL